MSSRALEDVEDRDKNDGKKWKVKSEKRRQQYIHFGYMYITANKIILKLQKNKVAYT